MTFENDRDVRLAKILAQEVGKILGVTAQLKQAQDPDNYIWENIAYTKP